jgi:hypothetical protein
MENVSDLLSIFFLVFWDEYLLELANGKPVY